MYVLVVCSCQINLVKTKINLEHTYLNSPYRAVNTLRIGYKNQQEGQFTYNVTLRGVCVTTVAVE